MNLNIEATEIYYEYADSIEAKMIDGGIYESIRGFASKLPEHSLRLADTIALVEDIRVESLNSNHLKTGIEIANFYASESLRLFDEGVKILEEHGWLIKNEGTIEVRGKARRESSRVAHHCKK